jgi:LAGLIDADG endonuclease
MSFGTNLFVNSLCLCFAFAKAKQRQKAKAKGPRDTSVAYYVKYVLKRHLDVKGSIRKLKHKRGYEYRCYNRAGLTKLSHLLRHKLRLQDKINLFNSRWVLRLQCLPFGRSEAESIANNQWLAGFIQGDGSSQIQNRKKQKPSYSGQVDVVLQIDLKTDVLLQQIKQSFGDYILGLENPKAIIPTPVLAKSMRQS